MIQIACLSLIVFGYILSSGNGQFGIGVSSIALIFFTQIYWIYKNKNLNLEYVIAIIFTGIISFCVAFFMNRDVSISPGQIKILDTLGSGHYEALLENNKIYLTSRGLNIGDILNSKTLYKVDSCQQCLFQNQLNFSLPDYRFQNWLFINGYSASSFDTAPIILDNQKNFFQQTKIFLEQKIYSLYGKNANILNGMLLGDKSSLSNEQKKLFQNAGLIHLMVASGGNISIIAILVGSILFFLPFYIRIGAIFCISFLYGFMIGLDTPILRALLMSAVAMIAIFSGRKSESLNNLSIAFLFIGISNPYIIWQDISFQLSFLAVLGIIIFNNFNTTKNKFLKPIFTIIFTSLGASFFTLPIILQISNNYNISSLVANIIISPFVGIISIGGILSLFFAPLVSIINFFIEGLINIANYFSIHGNYLSVDKNYYQQFTIIWYLILFGISILSIGKTKFASSS